MKISLRLVDGWSPRVENKGKETCDVCGAKLWIGPGKKNFYCDEVHEVRRGKYVSVNMASAPVLEEYDAVGTDDMADVYAGLNRGIVHLDQPELSAIL